MHCFHKKTNIIRYGIIVNNSTIEFLEILFDFTIILKQLGLILRRFKKIEETIRHEVAEMETT